MKRAALPVAFALGLPLVASAADCTRIEDSPENCTPLVACFQGAGEFFVGRAFGWDEGVLAGTTNTGQTCTGTWTDRNAFGTGQADFTCDSGLAGTVFFAYRDTSTGTVRGSGGTNAGHKVDAWSGPNIRSYLDATDATPGLPLLCDEYEIPLS